MKKRAFPIATAVLLIAALSFVLCACNGFPSLKPANGGPEQQATAPETVEMQTLQDEEACCSPTPLEHQADDGDGFPYADNELLVLTDDYVSRAETEKLAQKYNASVVGWIAPTHDYQWRLAESHTKEELYRLAEEIAAEQEIRRVSVNHLLEYDASAVNETVNSGSEWGNLDSEALDLQLLTSNENAEKSWNMRQINAFEAWELLNQNKTEVNPIRVGQIECYATSESHDDLSVRAFYNFGQEEHGTCVAGVLAADGTDTDGICGVYPYGKNNFFSVSLHGVQNDPQASRFSEMAQKTAFYCLLKNHVKVINCSYGTSDWLYRMAYYQLTGQNEQLQREINEIANTAGELGGFLTRCLETDGLDDFVIVTAAGNESNHQGKTTVINGVTQTVNTGDVNAMYASALNFIQQEEFPALFSRIIVTGATDHNGNRASYSDTGSRVDVWAPGGSNDGEASHRVFTTLPRNAYGYAPSWGTSLAAPHVAGMAALLWSLDNDLTGEQIKNIITGTKQNNGVIDVNKGMRRVLDRYLTATDADIDTFLDMYEKAFDLTNAERYVDFTSISLGELMRDYILNTWRFQGLYAYYGAPEDAQEHPASWMGVAANTKSEEGTFAEGPDNAGKWIPWIVEKVFDRDMEDVSGEDFRFENGRLYVVKHFLSGTGIPPYRNREINYRQLDDGTYVFTVTKTYDRHTSDYAYHTALLYDKENDLRYWRLFSITDGNDAKPAEENAPTLTNKDAFGLWTRANTAYATLLMASDPMDTSGISVYEDPETNTRYMLIENKDVNSKEELERYLSRYFEPEIYREQLSQQGMYLERSGRLYIRMSGIGSAGWEAKKLRVLSEDGNTAEIELTYYEYFSESNGTLELTLKKRNNVWRFSDRFPCFYDSLNYDNIRY